MRQCSFEHSIEALSLDCTSAQRRTYVALEAFSVRLEIFGGLLVQRVGSVRFEEKELRPVSYDHCKLAAQHTCSPTTTAFRFSTGFQSSRKMFKQTLPSRSMFGW